MSLPHSATKTVPETSIAGKPVVREMADLIAVRGKPGMIVSDIRTQCPRICRRGNLPYPQNFGPMPSLQYDRLADA